MWLKGAFFVILVQNSCGGSSPKGQQNNFFSNSSRHFSVVHPLRVWFFAIHLVVNIASFFWFHKTLLWTKIITFYLRLVSRTENETLSNGPDDYVETLCPKFNEPNIFEIAARRGWTHMHLMSGGNERRLV